MIEEINKAKPTMPRHHIRLVLQLENTLANQEKMKACHELLKVHLGACDPWGVLKVESVILEDFARVLRKEPENKPIAEGAPQ